jgi:hypothetical protein
MHIMGTESPDQTDMFNKSNGMNLIWTSGQAEPNEQKF